MLNCKNFLMVGLLILFVLTTIGHISAQGNALPTIENSGDTLYKGISVNGEILWTSRTDNPVANRTFDPNEEIRVIVKFKSPPLVKARRQGLALSLVKVDIESEHQRLKSDISAAEVGREFNTVFNGMALKATRAVISQIENLSYVEKVYPDVEVKALIDESVPLIRANLVWDSLGAQGNGVKIGIIDTGIDYMHPDLTANYIPGGYDFVNNDDDPYDDNGHGTHCAGIAAANGTLKGVAPQAKLMAFKVLDASGGGYSSWVIAGIEMALDPDGNPATDDGVDIMSLSLGGPGIPDDPISQAVDNAVEAGVVCAVAAGNSGPGNFSIESPGCARKAITVGASDKSDFMTSFSSRGPVYIPDVTIDIKPDITAPGYLIKSCRLGGGWVWHSGTSMATPHVAGASALIKQLHPDFSPEMIKSTLMEGVKDLGEDCFTQGSGRVDVYKSATLKGIITPGSLSLGIDDSNQGVWTKIDTLQIQSISSEQQDYSLSFEHNLPAGVDLSISPNTVLLNPAETQELIFTLSVDNIAVSPDISRPYTGKIVAQSATDTLRVPFTFAKAPTYQDGWPYVEANSPPAAMSLVAAQLDTLDEPEELLLSTYSNVYAWNHNGTFVNGWPIDPGNQSYLGVALDNGGRVTFGTYYEPYGAYVFLPSGSVASGWPKSTGQQYFYHSPVWADIDGDDTMEVIAVTHSGSAETGTVYAWNPDGSNVSGHWPVVINKYIGDVAVGDVNNDGKLEVVVDEMSQVAKWVYVISSNGEILYQWQPAGASPYGSGNSPVLADLDGDGDLEILLSGDSAVTAWRYNGEQFWPKRGVAVYEVSPIAVGDLDGDDSLDVVVCDRYSVYVWDNHGNLKTGWPVTIPNIKWTWSSAEISGPVIGDIDGDGEQEIVVHGYDVTHYPYGYWYIYAFEPNGQVVDGFPYIEPQGYITASTPVITDLDKDGDVEICSYARNSIDNSLRVVVYDLPDIYDSLHTDWPMLQHDPQRTGCFKKTGGSGVVDEPGNGEIPSGFVLSQNYPNPFNMSTKIEFTLKNSGFVSLDIYDILGRKVRVLVSQDLTVGHKSVVWDGKDNSGNNVASGAYFYKIRTKNFSETKKMLLLK